MTGNAFRRALLAVLAALLALAALPAAAQQLVRGKCAPYRGEVAGNYDFWLYTPGEYESDRHPLPLVIFLHGASLCGRNLSRVRTYGVLHAIDKGKVVPALVLAPQNSGGAWSPAKIDGLLEWTKAHYAVDTTRVYVLGMSLGGYGTMDFCAAYPHKVAAAMALCGGCSVAEPDGLGELPLWIMHGTADRAVGIQQSKRVVEYLQRRGADKLLRYDWLPGANHGAPARVFYLQKTYDWLFSHSLADRPREVDRTFEITQEDLRNTYDELRWFRGMYAND